jgi:branched-chain amino acid transport system permease protein
MDFLNALSLTAGEIIGINTAAYALCALGLAMHFGYTGLLNFGQAAFAATGAYGYAIGVLTFHLPWWGASILGMLTATVFAFILGVPTLRLRADYLAIVTIAAAEAFKYLMTTSKYEEVTGGASGLNEFGADFYALNPFPKGDYNLVIVNYTQDELWVNTVAWLLVIVAAVLMLLLTRSPWGRVLRGIREDEDAARALGKNVFKYKMQALIIGGVLASLGGQVFVLSSQSNTPLTWGTNFTFMLWTIMMLGGAATVLGPVAGSAIFFGLLMLIQQILNGLVSSGWLPFLGTEQVAQIRYLLVGVALMLLVIFRPQGLFGNKRETYFNG